MTATPFHQVLVAMPACDEAATIESCLDAVAIAARTAIETGSVQGVRVAVAAHRCSDDTAARAEARLRAYDLDRLVIEIAEPAPVGVVRTRLVQEAMASPTVLDAAVTWVLSTDADSLVPPDWITALAGVAATTGADLIAGLTDLDGWEAGPAAREVYDAMLAAGMTADGHAHVYAANLAVAYPTFLAAGGFPGLTHGEEHGLVASVRASGGQVVGALEPVVRTSARMPGRAVDGLGTLLARLAAG